MGILRLQSTNQCNPERLQWGSPGRLWCPGALESQVCLWALSIRPVYRLHPKTLLTKPGNFLPWRYRNAHFTIDPWRLAGLEAAWDSKACLYSTWWTPRYEAMNMEELDLAWGGSKPANSFFVHHPRGGISCPRAPHRIPKKRLSFRMLFVICVNSSFHSRPGFWLKIINLLIER